MNTKDKELKEAFCRWHRLYIDAGLIEDSCDNCIINVLEARGLSFLDPKNVTLKKIKNIDYVISLIGPSAWQKFKNDPEGLKEHIAVEFPHLHSLFI